MGQLLAKIKNSLSTNKEKTLVMFGLDDAGKTTIFYKLKRNRDIPIPSLSLSN